VWYSDEGRSYDLLARALTNQLRETLNSLAGEIQVMDTRPEKRLGKKGSAFMERVTDTLIYCIKLIDNMTSLTGEVEEPKDGDSNRT
jgi:hypothetical protein